MARLVIVTDMQNGFIDPQGTLYVGEAGRVILPTIQQILEAELAKGSTLVFTVDSHEPNDPEFEMWPPHCLRGTWECEVVPELQKYVAGARIQPKRRYSAFFETGLEEYVANLQPEKVIIMGVCTDICVMHTVADLRYRDYDVTVVRDAVATFDDEAHEFALKHIEKILGAQVVDSAALLGEANDADRNE
jgi:nicotinamidase-related amidase